jgi:hypothetical protein
VARQFYGNDNVISHGYCYLDDNGLLITADNLPNQNIWKADLAISLLSRVILAMILPSNLWLIAILLRFYVTPLRDYCHFIFLQNTQSESIQNIRDSATRIIR